MTVIDIDETTEVGKQILRTLSENPEAGKVREYIIPRNEDGMPLGYGLDDVFDNVDKNLSEVYGIDFAKVSRMIESNKLTDEELTDELLLSPEFEYKPDSDFKTKPLSPHFKLNPQLLAALSE